MRAGSERGPLNNGGNHVSRVRPLLLFRGIAARSSAAAGASPAPPTGRLCFRVLCIFWEDAVVAITREEVLHVAGLARLELTGEEVERFREQLNAILEAGGKGAELGLPNVEPAAHPLGLVNALAHPTPRPALRARGGSRASPH